MQAAALQKSLPISFILKNDFQMMKTSENTFTESKHARNINQAAGDKNMITHPSSPKREDLSNKQVSSITSNGSSSMETDQRDSPSARKNQDDQLRVAKSQMGEVREENKKLKRTLSQIVKDYKCLQMNFLDVFEKEAPTKLIDNSSNNQEDEETEFVSLSLGRSSTYCNERRDKKKENVSCRGNEQSKFDQALELGLDCRFDPSPKEKNPSPEKSNDDMEEDQEAIEMWPPSKSLKSTRTEDSEILQQTPLKKARVSIRAICNAPTMNDGCQWRKYGQKIAKGNPCPRAYYRCTVSPSCPVRKHVQRCAEDRSILVTTYEGTHNHQLPVSATAMASTTSAAASMLKSTSSTSQPSNATTFANLHGLNNYNSRLPQYSSFNFPTTTISTTQSHPTITLDLTVPTTSSHFNKSSSNFLPSSAPRFPPTCLDFASPFSFPSSSSSSSISNMGRQTLKESYYQPQYMIKNNFQSSSQQPSPETIAAATKVLTSNPTFRSALAAAITSFVGNGGDKSGVQENRVAGENSGHVNLGYSSTDSAVGCATSYLNRLPSVNTQKGNVPPFPTLHHFSASKSTSVSPVHKSEQIE